MSLIFLLLFLLNPFICILVYGLHLNLKTKIETKNFYFFYFLLSVFLGFINITKVPESDLAHHATDYLNARGLSIFQYLGLFGGGKEFVFYIFNYLFYYISEGSIKFWILVLTVFAYFPFFVAVHKFQLSINPKASYILFSICIAAFFPQLFSLSAHLIRQFIAGSIAIYFLVEKIAYRKNKWWLVILGSLIHSSSFILFILGYISFLKDRPNKSNVVKYFFLFASLIGYQLIATILLPFFSDIAGIGYALNRASSDTKFELDSFSYSNYLFIIIIITVMIKNVFTNNFFKKSTSIMFICNIVLIQIFFILINIRQLELSNRLFFYLCFFFPLIIPLQFKFKRQTDLRKLIIIALIVFFAFRLDFGTWKYDSIPQLLTSSSFNFLTRHDFKNF